MKKLILNLPTLLVVSALLMFSACKKDNNNTEDDSVSAQDAASVSNAVGMTADDASAVAGNVSSFSGKTESLGWTALLCGATAIDSTIAGGTQITITYGGASCFGVTRTGTVTLTLANGPWKKPGATLTITFNNLKITDFFGNGQITINGAYVLTNETGGLAWKVLAGLSQDTTIAHRGQSTDLNITFGNGAQRTWSVDRTRSFANTGGATVTINDYSEHGNNEDSWGTNRFGNTFSDFIADTISSNNQPNDNYCTWLPYHGEYTHEISNRTAVILFGADSSGVQIASPTQCGNDGYFITYTNASGQTRTKFIEYLHVP